MRTFSKAPQNRGYYYVDYLFIGLPSTARAGSQGNTRPNDPSKHPQAEYIVAKGQSTANTETLLCFAGSRTVRGSSGAVGYEDSTWTDLLIVALYAACLVGLGAWGVHRLLLAWLPA